MEDKEQDPGDLLDDIGVAERDLSTRGNQNQMSMLAELEKLPIMLVRCSFNNTFINIQDHTGRLLTWISSVSIGVGI